jgi:hypothetical protein
MIKHFLKSRNLRIALTELVEQVRDKLPEKDTSAALELVEYDEFEVSFELICTQLFEYDIKVSAAVYQKIEELGRLMKLDESEWQMLKN